MSRFWSWCLVNIVKMKFDQILCLNFTCDMTKISYFGKQNSTLGSVVPLAMFVLPFDTVSPSSCKLNSVLFGSTWWMTGKSMMLQSPWFQKEPLCKPEKRFGKDHRSHGGRERKLFSVSDVGIVALAGSCTCVANPHLGVSQMVRKVIWITINYKLAFI